jgi:hypothetical protein
MKRTHLGFFAALAGLILSSAAAAAAQQAAVVSTWTDQPPVIDGLTKDWAGITFAEWKMNAVSYAFRNDSDSLYVLLVIRDPKYRSSIEGTGVKLFIDAKGGKAKDYAILFRRQRLEPEQYIAHLEKRGPVSENDKAAIRRKAGFYLYHHQVLDRKGKPVEEMSEAIAHPAVFKYASEGPGVAYEFSVPLARSSERVSGVGAGPGASVGIGFEWGGETEAMRKAATKRFREQANVANEELEGAERPIIGSAAAGPAPKKYDFWTSVKLAARSE